MRSLILAREQYLLETEPAACALTDEQWAALDPALPDNLLNRMVRLRQGVQAALAHQGDCTKRLKALAERLAQYVSHFHQVLDLGIARRDFAPAVRGFYGRDLMASRLPRRVTHADLAEAAEYVVRGEAARQAAEGSGFVPMGLPSAAQVGALLEQFRAARAESDAALEATDFAREAVSGLLPAARALARDICETVQYFYRKDPSASSRRAKCARWGVVYRYGKKESAVAPAAGEGNGEMAMAATVEADGQSRMEG